MRSNAPTSKHLKLADAAPSDIVAMARRARESAKAFSAIVDRFGTEMPDAVDRFHDAMKAFRAAADHLRSGAPLRVEPTPQQPVALPHAA
ncbi:hypothetical protein ACM64Y_14710 [Novispirillum sp. DQ9]|uniref:hypothetical protein n=1 Tax=Novispirillum sp. DQ9 TaxID=3398612 RepID=UPI003C79A66A